MTDFFSRLFSGEFSGRKLWPNGNDKKDPKPPQIAGNDRPPSTAPLVKKPKIGLALSSGAAKGLAHIGVIQILEEHGIEIEAVAGSSMGAYVGALWAAGHDGDDLYELAATVKNKWDNLRLLDPVFPPRRGFVRGQKVRARLHDSLGDRNLENLSKEVYIVATELETLSRKVFDSGSVVDAVHASIAIPGICEPVTIDEIDYTDGGVADPLPVNVLKDAGMDHVIAVCVMPTAEELQFKRKKRRTKNQESKYRSWFSKHFNYWAEGNVFNIQRSAEFGMQIRLAELSMREADVRIRPIVCDAKWHAYTEYEKYIEVGRQATEASLDDIKTLCQPIEVSTVDPELSHNK